MAAVELLLEPIIEAEATLYDVQSGRSYPGCRVQGIGEFRRVVDPERVFVGHFEDRYWRRDHFNAADGPDGTLSAFRRGDHLCLYLLEWVGPDDTETEAESLAAWENWYRVDFNCVEAPEGVQSLRRAEDVRQRGPAGG